MILVDDLLATGGTVNAAIELISNSGAIVVSALLVVELLYLNGRNNLPKILILIVWYLMKNKKIRSLSFDLWLTLIYELDLTAHSDIRRNIRSEKLRRNYLTIIYIYQLIKSHLHLMIFLKL